VLVLVLRVLVGGWMESIAEVVVVKLCVEVVVVRWWLKSRWVCLQAEVRCTVY
jgi:hypothetical protein